jgi:hypothetical protein
MDVEVLITCSEKTAAFLKQKYFDNSLALPLVWSEIEICKNQQELKS